MVLAMCLENRFLPLLTAFGWHFVRFGWHFVRFGWHFVRSIPGSF